MFTQTHRPAPSYHTYQGLNHSRMTEAMEALGAFAFLGLARLRRIVGDGGEIRMDAAGCRGAARLLECSPASVYRLLGKMASGGFVRWWTEDGHICIEVMPPLRPSSVHAVIEPTVQPEASERPRRDRGRAVPPLAVMAPKEASPDEALRSRRDRASIHDHVRNHEELASEPVAIAPSEQPATAATTSEEPTQSAARTPTPQLPAPPSPAPVDPRLLELAERGIYAGLGRRLLAAAPALTIADFDRLTGVLARRGRCTRPAAVVVASVLARGEAIDEATPTGYAGAGTAQTGPQVSSRLINSAPIDCQTRGTWLARFRAADPADRQNVLDRFQHEVLGQLARSA